MSVASRATARRWSAAVAGILVVAFAPTAAGHLPGRESGADPRRLLAMARHSSNVAHEGLVETTGTLGLPDLPRLGDVAALLGGTSRARVWWRTPQAWRVDRITATGESGIYAIPDGVQTWDFEANTVERALDTSPVRLPRIDDLLPPQAARRALAGTTDRDRVTSLPAKRVAGRDADGVRVRPADPSSTIGRLDLYIDQRTGLPLSLLVVPRGSEVAALRTGFVDVSIRSPKATVLRPRMPPFSHVHTTVTPDLASAVNRYAPFALPDQLAGSPQSRDLVGDLGGSATYGRGLARFVLLPLPSRLGRPAMEGAAGSGATPLDVGAGGDALLIATPLLNVVVAHSDGVSGGRSGRLGRWYLLAGTVDGATLQSAVGGLVSDPPAFR